MSSDNVAEKVQDEKWVQIQKKTFTRWSNTFLKERMLKVDDLETGFADGTLLIALLEIISSKSVATRFAKNPRVKSQKLENVQYCLDFLRKEGIKLVNIGAEDIVDSKLKLILGLVWTIILRYQIQIEQGKSARSDLLNWVRSKIPEYNINNFATDWNDGRAICGLANAVKPGVFPDHFSLDPANALSNATAGENVAESELEIPKVLLPEDMINPEVDELSMMTYISYFRDYEANELKKRSDEELSKTPVAGKCRAYGPGLEKAEHLVETEFTIEAINVLGKRVPNGGANFVVTITGPSGEIEPNQTDNQDGTYRVTYTPNAVGVLSIEVKLVADPIPNSPWRVTVNRTQPDYTKTRVYGPGVESGTVDEAANFTVELLNRFGTRIPDGGDKVEVQVTGPHDSAVKSSIVDNKDGSYSASYDPVEDGEHSVAVTVAGNPVPNSPFKVLIGKNPEEVDASTTIAYGPGLEGGSTSESADFTVETRKPNGDRYTKGGALVDVWVSDPSGNEVPVTKTDKGDGTFKVSYEPKEVGAHEVSVVVRRKHAPQFYDHIQGSTFSVPIVAGTDAGYSVAFGPGLGNNVYDTLPTTFTIQAKDRRGENITKGGDPFEVSITDSNGNNVPADVKDNNDGSYTVNYAPSAAGKHVVDVTLKGAHIKDAPFTVNIKAGADFGTSSIENFNFTIRAKTKAGEPKTEGGDNFTVDITAPSGEAKAVDVRDNNDGSYFVSYSLAENGQHSISVKVNGVDIQGSPFIQGN